MARDKGLEVEGFFWKMTKSPGEQLKMYIESYINENNLDHNLKKEVPRKWEKYGDFILFDARSFSSGQWLQQEEEFWIQICNILKCKRIALKNQIQSDGYRTPNVKMLLGNDPWITHIDNSIKYSWNINYNMFCAGNASERHRIAQLDCTGEIVVDMFAGIGYFVLPFLVHAKAKFVHAIEWNPNAIIALKKNLKLNKVYDKCMIHVGDNRLVCPKGIADRVNLGLIPSSEGSWTRACEALKPQGGILHIHGNVETKKTNITCEKCSDLGSDSSDGSKISLSTDEIISFDKSNFSWKRQQWKVWGIHVLHSLITILHVLDHSKKWRCTIEKVNFVKSYAPHVDHLVLDVLLTKMEER